MEVAITTWIGMMAPAGTPKEIMQRLNATMAKELFANPAMKEKYLTTAGLQTLPPAGGTPEQFAAFLKSEVDMFSSVVKVTGVKVE